MGKRDEILAAAPTFTGLPYRLDPPPDGVTSIDCSLFVLKAYEAAGVSFSGIRTAEQIRQACVPIEWADVLPGDLLFFEDTYDAGPPAPDGHIASHIGISLGAGSGRMWDAHERDSSPDAVGLTVINPSAYWQEHLFEARRAPQVAAEAAVLPQALPRGIDVASYQGNPNWDAVKASGIAFAFSKVTEDTGYTNPTFKRNWSEMKRVGIIRGAYHFARPEVNDAGGEANYFLDQIDAAGGLQTGDMLALDLEAGAGDLGPWTLDFLRRCEARAGYKPLIYTGTWFSGPHNLGAYPELAQYGLWLAAYQASIPACPAPWSEIAFWQYSDKGQVPGINGNVDMNVFNGDISRMAFYGKPGAVIPAPGTFSVGDGIRAMMTKASDAPATDELFFKQGSKDEWSEAYGASGSRYVYVTSLNRVFRYDPVYA